MDEPVKRVSNGGFTMLTVATLGELIAAHEVVGKLKEENQLLREHVADRNAALNRVALERRGIEIEGARRGEEIDRLKEEARLSKEREAESDARLEWYQAEREAQEQRIDGLNTLSRKVHADLESVCKDRRALREERDKLKAENERLKRAAGCGYVNAPRVEVDGEEQIPHVHAPAHENRLRRNRTGPLASERLVASGEATLGSTEEVKTLVIDLGPAMSKLAAIVNNLPPLLQALGVTLDDLTKPPSKD